PQLYTLSLHDALPIMLRNGEICKYDSFVISGSFKASYLHHKTGKEEILFFAIEDWWATDLNSFYQQEPSRYNIQALENAVVEQIDRKSTRLNSSHVKI